MSPHIIAKYPLASGVGRNHSLLRIALQLSVYVFRSAHKNYFLSFFNTLAQGKEDKNSLSLLPFYKFDDTEIKWFAQGNLVMLQV